MRSSVKITSLFFSATKMCMRTIRKIEEYVTRYGGENISNESVVGWLPGKDCKKYSFP